MNKFDDCMKRQKKWLMASKLYGVNATIIIFVFVLYCIGLFKWLHDGWMGRCGKSWKFHFCMSNHCWSIIWK